MNTTMPFTLEGTQFDSIGFLDFGNDDLWEVFAPVTLPIEDPDGFVHNNFPVYLASHNNIGDLKPLAFFFDLYSTGPHINEITIQLGALLNAYIEERNK